MSLWGANIQNLNARNAKKQTVRLDRLPDIITPKEKDSLMKAT